MVKKRGLYMGHKDGDKLVEGGGNRWHRMQTNAKRIRNRQAALRRPGESRIYRLMRCIGDFKSATKAGE
jgi:hypothetical protein